MGRQHMRWENLRAAPPTATTPHRPIASPCRLPTRGTYGRNYTVVPVVYSILNEFHIHCIFATAALLLSSAFRMQRGTDHLRAEIDAPIFQINRCSRYVPLRHNPPTLNALGRLFIQQFAI